jgi:hypothetical protein
MMMQNTKFDTWAILDMMGHQRLAGRVTEETIGGVSLLRVDIPELNNIPAWTTYITANSLYQMTPVTEELARSMAAKIGKMPITFYDLPQQWREKIQSSPAGLPAPDDDDESYGCDEDEDEEEEFDI